MSAAVLGCGAYLLIGAFIGGLWLAHDARGGYAQNSAVVIGLIWPMYVVWRGFGLLVRVVAWIVDLVGPSGRL